MEFSHKHMKNPKINTTNIPITMPQSEHEEKPFAPGNSQITPTVDHHHSSLFMEPKSSRPKHRNYIICGCIAAVLLIIAVVLLVLSLTVFHIRNPQLNLNSIHIQGLESIAGSNNLPSPNTNLTVLADVSIKNPNAASFRFNEVTTGIYYDDVLVGEAQTPSGRAGARRTVGLNMTIDVMVNRIPVPRLVNDLAAGALPVSSYSVITGRVKVLIVKKDVVVRLNCTMTVNVRNRTVENSRCRTHVSS